MQTFWSDDTGTVSVAPMETHIKLDASWPEARTEARLGIFRRAD